MTLVSEDTESFVVVGAPSSNTERGTRIATICGYILFILVIAGPRLSFGDSKLYNSGEGSPIRQVAYILLFAVILMSFGTGNKSLRRFGFPISMGLAITWLWITLLWSESVATSLRRLGVTTMIILCVYNIVSVLSYERASALICNVLLGVLVANFASVIFFPGFAIHDSSAFFAGSGVDPALAGAWHGVFTQKNFAGLVCAVTVLFFLFDARHFTSTMRWIVVIASLVFMYKTSSKTSLGFIGVSIIIGMTMYIYDQKYRVLVLLGIGLMIGTIAMAIYVAWDVIIHQVYRPDAFTGRIQIWLPMLRYWNDHPQGSGFGAFWDVGPGGSWFHYIPIKSWLRFVAIGHDGYLDVLIQTGVIGLSLTILALAVAPIFRIFWSPEMNAGQRALLISAVAFVLLDNLFESCLWDRDTIGEVTLLYTIMLIRSADSKANTVYSYRTLRLTPIEHLPSGSERSGLTSAS